MNPTSSSSELIILSDASLIHAKQTLCEYCTTVQPLIANASSDFAELPKASAEPSHQKIENLAQELVDLLGTALADFKFGGGGQEAYVAGIHGTQMRPCGGDVH